MTKRFAVALAVAALAFAGFGTSPVSAANALPGAVWSETLPTGERVEFQRSPEGMDITTHELVKRNLFSCTTGYTCVWTAVEYGGTFGRYNTNNVYANTANGVAHCWNMSSPFNNNTASWANFSTDRAIQFTNWVNCNTGGGTLDMGVNSHWDCDSNPYEAVPYWCGVEAYGHPRTSALRAFA